MIKGERVKCFGSDSVVYTEGKQRGRREEGHDGSAGDCGYRGRGETDKEKQKQTDKQELPQRNK